MYFGADCSTLLTTEAEGGKFYVNGKEGELLSLLREAGFSALRVKLWLNPYDSAGNPYGGGDSDLKKLITLAKRGRALGMELLLDLHYSDFWCDPGRQCTPKAWAGLSLKETARALKDYTRSVLDALAKEGIFPERIQPGNEITNGMLWPLGKITETRDFGPLCELLLAGTKAIRECSDGKILLHLESSGNNALYREWFGKVLGGGVPCDGIGVSYYPFWHGNFEELAFNLTDCAKRFDKDVYILETAYPFTGKHFDPKQQGAALVINENLKMADGSEPPFPFTKAGQKAYIEALIKTFAAVPRSQGLYWWEPGWLPTRGSTWATAAGRRYAGEEDKRGGNEWANQCLFDYEGNAAPALQSFSLAE